MVSNTSEDLLTSNVTQMVRVPQTGYDLPVIGLKTGHFNIVHVPAIACISVSLCCAITVILVSFYYNKNKSFFNWLISDRFVVYLALCDGFYHLGTLLSHSHYLIIRDHVSPPWVCYIYSAITVEFALAQVLLINVIAVNAFILMYYEFQIQFGQRDHRLILHTTGLPFIFLVICGAVGHLGPNGQICAMDGVRSDVSGVVITSLFTMVLIINVILYALTWRKIVNEAKQVKICVQGSNTDKAVQKAAKAMMMFVAAFFIQWWAYSVFGIWRLANITPPILLAKLVGIFSNLGGIMNAMVYMIIRWEKFKDAKGGAKINKLLLSSSSGEGNLGAAQQDPLLNNSNVSKATLNTDSSHLQSSISVEAV